jgi:molybdopterin converting factor small subunit
MIRVKVELWLWLGDELGEAVQSPSDMRSILEVDAEEGVTVRDLFSDLAERYRSIEEKVFDRRTARFHPTVVVTLNDRVISRPALYERPLQGGDKLLALPVHSGG